MVSFAGFNLIITLSVRSSWGFIAKAGRCVCVGDMPVRNLDHTSGA